MKRVTVKNLEENLVATTKCDDNISIINDIEYVWTYRKTDNLGRTTKVLEKENADCVEVKPREEETNRAIVLELK